MRALPTTFRASATALGVQIIAVEVGLLLAAGWVANHLQPFGEVAVKTGDRSHGVDH